MIKTQKGDIVLCKLETLQELQSLWPFFRRGLGRLNELYKGVKKVDELTFFRVVIDTIDKKDDGFVTVAQYFGEPVAFLISFINTSPYAAPSALVYAAFKDVKHRTVSQDLQTALETWARSRGIEELHAFSPRFSGSGIALFEKKFKFRRQLVFFVKPLV